MYTKEKNAGDSLRKHIPILKKSLGDLYSGASPRLSALMVVLIFIFAGILIMYGIVNRIEDTVDIGLTATPQVGETEYTAQNKIFDTYTPMVNVKVIIGGKERIVNTDLVSVGEILANLGVYPDDDDELNHSTDDIVTEGMSIVLRKIDEIGIVMYEVIDYQTETKYIHTIPAGTKEVVQEGKDGLSTQVMRQLYIDGVLDSETVISEELTKKPVTKKVNIGLGGTFTGNDGKRYPYSYYIDVIATAYGGEMFSGLTYTGKQVELGMIAVDPDYIPLGSKVYVVGDYGDYGVCYAEDTGSKVIGKSIDIYMGDDLQVMKEFGRRNMRVYILK